ncbi:uncharacterized protein PRCAT00000005001 [Priceomyces carsonii]|uniref:uncharacterized protein n=1 Tax=Priceomyces carsonii TaxID=28549 RepID=UPI002ED86D9A|nr:unnamed protein product [Priceomyces carsonii]
MKVLHLFSIAASVSVSMANNWATYPQVPQTASINGFADPIYGKLPKCARSCVQSSVKNTPCPYWDTGCLCVMPQWSGEVAQCFASECSGSDVKSATSLALSLCSSVGANQWLMPATVSSELRHAAQVTGEVTSDISVEPISVSADYSSILSEYLGETTVSSSQGSSAESESSSTNSGTSSKGSSENACCRSFR